MLSVIIPTRNAQTGLPRLLGSLGDSQLRLVVSDGGSIDQTLAIAARASAVICLGGAGRGAQLARGASWAGEADTLLFLHADCVLPEGWRAAVEAFRIKHPMSAGYFRFKGDSRAWQSRLMNRVVALRCWAWRLPYGDQGLLISREMYDAVGGFSQMELFEDVAIVDAIKAKYGRSGLRPLPLALTSDISAYHAQGFARRCWRNFKLLRSYRRGASVEILAKGYRGI